jgi:hypothetical protein
MADCGAGTAWAVWGAVAGNPGRCGVHVDDGSVDIPGLLYPVIGGQGHTNKWLESTPNND